jgi:hypothetical protein
MGWARCVLIAAALAAPALAQTPQGYPPSRVETDCLPRAAAARAVALPYPPVAVISESGALARDCTIISVHIASSLRDRPKGDPIIYFRREQGDLGRPPRIDYADSRTCPAAIDAVHALEGFKPSGLYLTALHPTDSMVVTADGAYYQFWAGRGASEHNGNRYQVNAKTEASGWNYPGLGEAWSGLTRLLQSCWTGTKPQ